MKIRFFLFFIALFGVLACDPYAPNPPEDLIPKDSLTALYKELILVETHYTDREMNDSLYSLVNARAAVVLDTYGYSQKQFNNSVEFYRLNGHDMEFIIGDVIQQLSKDEVELRNSLKGVEKDTLSQ